MIVGDSLERKETIYQITRIRLFKNHRIVYCYSLMKGAAKFKMKGGYKDNL